MSPIPEEFLSIFFNLFELFLFIVYNFVSSRSSPFSTSHFTANNFKILLNCFTYSDPSSFLQPDRKWCTVSLWSPHNLNLSHSTNPLIFFHVLVSIIYFCNANIDDVSWDTFQPARVFFTTVLRKGRLLLVLNLIK